MAYWLKEKVKQQNFVFVTSSVAFSILINKPRPLKMNELEGEKGLCVALRGTTQKHNGNVMYLSTMATGSAEDWGRRIGAA